MIVYEKVKCTRQNVLLLRLWNLRYFAWTDTASRSNIRPGISVENLLPAF